MLALRASLAGYQLTIVNYHVGEPVDDMLLY